MDFCWQQVCGVIKDSHLRSEFKVDIQPSGYLPFAVPPGPEDRLIFSPSYIFPVDILERGIMHGLKFIRQVVIVDGFDGRTLLLDTEKLLPDMNFAECDVQKEYLELRISPVIAAEIAKDGAVPSDCRGWKKAIKNRKVIVGINEMKIVWRIYAVSDGKVLDTFTGNAINSAGLLGMLFN